MMYAVILFCALSVSARDCDEVTAKRFEHVPGGNALPFMCLKEAEAWAAEHGIVPGPGEYPKIRCSRHEFGARVG